MVTLLDLFMWSRLIIYVMKDTLLFIINYFPCISALCDSLGTTLFVFKIIWIGRLDDL